MTNTHYIPKELTHSQNIMFTNFKTEKELILHIIENYSNKSSSQLYNSLARKEWKKKYYDDSADYQIYTWDNWLMRDLVIFSDDEDIIRALHTIRDTEILFFGLLESPASDLITVNKNIPDDIFEDYLIINDDDIEQLTRMSTVEYKINGEKRNRIINSRINELISLKRKKKEDKTKDKLKAFLITAAATQSVLKGKSIDDVVDASITEDVDDDVLDYMNKLLGKVK